MESKALYQVTIKAGGHSGQVQGRILACARDRAEARHIAQRWADNQNIIGAAFEIKRQSTSAPVYAR